MTPKPSTCSRKKTFDPPVWSDMLSAVVSVGYGEASEQFEKTMANIVIIPCVVLKELCYKSVYSRMTPNSIINKKPFC